ncbi:MAG: hypothetical protein ABIK98_08915 [Pseudomonadota bacterium]
MPPNHNPQTLADPKRFRTIQDLTQMRPDCGASIDDSLIIDNEFMLIIDLTHIGNLLSSYNSLSAAYVRIHGVIVASIARHSSFPVLWRDPFLLLPLSDHFKDDLTVYMELGQVVARISCPAGSLLLLPDREDLPTPLSKTIDEALIKETGARIKLPNGTYRVFYEQFDEVPEGSKKERYQNIAVQRQALK